MHRFFTCCFCMYRTFHSFAFGEGGIILPHFKCCCSISSVTLHDEGEEGRTRGASWQQKFSSLTFDGHFPSSIAAVLAIHAVPRPLVSQGPWCQVQLAHWTALADLRGSVAVREHVPLFGCFSPHNLMQAKTPNVWCLVTTTYFRVVYNPDIRGFRLSS